ncbi:hypothetical protein [Salarchaeum sp. JOR-1]|uniref:hypothetical protein n=1 Tax=Salarchaeum sp. JOR-1 TaxID=2599399 RepID=UPI0011987D49|nr:hypothetical protein [Salarchaeum sp. JOR-1]QDX39841.1 hypothetical protein FQU85_02605 [Salarchaeum sp. JOR-1]
MSEQATFTAFAGSLFDERIAAERDASQAIRQGDDGVRECARRIDRALGTVEAVLARAAARRRSGTRECGIGAATRGAMAFWRLLDLVNQRKNRRET